MKYTEAKIGQRVKFRNDIIDGYYGKTMCSTFGLSVNQSMFDKVKGKSFKIVEVHTLYKNLFRISPGFGTWYVLETTIQTTDSYEIY